MILSILATILAGLLAQNSRAQTVTNCDPISGIFDFTPPIGPIHGNCSSSYFLLTISEGDVFYDENAIKDVNIIDANLEDFLVRSLNGNLTDEVYHLVTHGNEFLVTWDILNENSDETFINLEYEEVPLTIREPAQFLYENSTFSMTDVGPNEKQEIEFTGTFEAHLFEVKMDFQRPTNGFLALENGNGRIGIMTMQRGADLMIPVAVSGSLKTINVTDDEGAMSTTTTMAPPEMKWDWTYPERNTTFKIVTLNTAADYEDAKFSVQCSLGTTYA